MDQNVTQVHEVCKSNTIENFFGVYLLCSLNPKYKGRTYIGFTVDPNRRITQHNKGSHAGGARRTNNRGPWEMVLIVHGFPNDISALRFEWAWQHPQRSRRLRLTQRKKSSESQYQYCLRTLLEMLRMGPWNKLPLTINWLAEHRQQDFPADMCPPLHMPIVFGKVHPKKVSEEKNFDGCSPPLYQVCDLCSNPVISEDAVRCISPSCSCVTHIFCLSKHFIGNQSQDILPVEGTCPKCKCDMLWGDIIRKKKGCNKNISG